LWVWSNTNGASLFTGNLTIWTSASGFFCKKYFTEEVRYAAISVYKNKIFKKCIANK
jgi:hypothetical protein